MANQQQPYEAPAIESSVSYASGDVRSYELGDFAERFELEDLGGHLGLVRCRQCSFTTHAVHTPVSRAGALELAQHAASHVEPSQ